MDKSERRQDQVMARPIEKALEMQRAFGAAAARTFLALRGIAEQRSRAVLQDRYDRRYGERRDLARRVSGAKG